MELRETKTQPCTLKGWLTAGEWKSIRLFVLLKEDSLRKWMEVYVNHSLANREGEK